MNILIVNGPNLNMLGQREPNIYGNIKYIEFKKIIQQWAKECQVKIKMIQSNHEGKLIDFLHKNYKKYDGFIFNLGALTHYSYALRDCIVMIHSPKVEVHLSDLNQREDFRKYSVIKDIVDLTIQGKGIDGYLESIRYLAKGVNNDRKI